MDFTLSVYKELLSALQKDYQFVTYHEYNANSYEGKLVILRHDVDLRPHYSLRFARIQHESGIKGSYYFRMVPQSYNEDIIREISSLGHEIGYHYETMDTSNGNVEKALEEFARNLGQLRLLAPVTTICMHGSPLSKWDNRDLWRKEKSSVVSRQSIVKGHNPEPGTWNHQDNKPAHLSPLTAHYTDFGIIGEPYFDIDFKRVFYLTDTGRRWDGEKVSVRDKVGGQRSAVGGRRSAVGNFSTVEPWNFGTLELKLHSTHDIINAANNQLLPDQIMMTFHPQRWTDKPLPWLQELVMQNVKNVVKRVVLRVKG